MVLKVNRNLINKHDAYGFSVLHYAAEKDQHECIEFLLDRGALPNIQTRKEGFSSIYIAASLGHLNSIKTLCAW